jgi:pantothenate kinase
LILLVVEHTEVVTVEMRMVAVVAEYYTNYDVPSLVVVASAEHYMHYRDRSLEVVTQVEEEHCMSCMGSLGQVVLLFVDSAGDNRI